MSYRPDPTAIRRAIVEDVLPLLALAAMAVILLYFVSGCTAASFDVQAQGQEIDDGDVFGDGAVPDEVLHHAPEPARLAAGDAALEPMDTAPPVVDATDAAVDDAIADTRGDTKDGGVACARRCLVAGATGANLPLGSTLCTFDQQCCSGSCFVSHPGTGERGVCTAPSGDPTTPHWCGAPGEWCLDAVEAGIARCVP